MRLLGKDLKHGAVSLVVQGQDDLWHLSQIIDPGDHVSGDAERKIKLGSGDQQKRTIWLTIKVEKAEYREGTKQLRILGTTTEELEEIPKGSYQTIEAQPGGKLTITKERWLSYQLQRLDEAARSSFSDTLVCLLDRESAIIAILKSHGYEVLAEFSGEVAKKVAGSAAGKAFFPEVIKKLVEYDSRFSLGAIVLGSPAFWKEEALALISDPALRKKVKMATVNDVSRNGIEEVLRDKTLTTVLASDRTAKEAVVMEELLHHIATDGPGAYGELEVEKAAQVNAIKTLLLVDTLISERRAAGAFAPLERLMAKVDSTNGETIILSGKNDPGRRLMALGGIGALLRYKMNW